MERYKFFRDHVSLRRLLAYREGDVSGRERRRIESHLATCARCAEELRVTRVLEEATRNWRPPAPPSGLLEEVLAFREQGGRVLLPTGPWGPSSEGASRRVIPAVGILFLFATASIVLLLTRTPEARAGASSLAASHWTRGAARVTSLEFRASSALANEGRVRARGWVRGADDPPPRASLGQFVSTILTAQGRGRFSGGVILPPTAVYAAFVVEDIEGRRVDANGHRFWEVLATDDSGTPLFAALRQQYRVAESRQMPEALEIARRMTDLYPNEPEGWFYRYVREGLLAPASQDSLLRFHRSQFRRLEDALIPAREVSSDRLGAMARYAQELNSETSEFWLTTLEERAPQHPAAVDAVVLDALGTHWRDPRALLSRLESVWWGLDAPTELLAEQGFSAAMRIGDPAAVRTWADRYRRLRPDLGLMIAERMATVRELDAVTAHMIRGQLREPPHGDHANRKPVDDIQTHKIEQRWIEGRLLVVLGEILARRGQAAAARDTLRRAVAYVRDPDLHARLEHALMAAADTAGALRMRAHVEADPLVPSATGGAEETTPLPLDAVQWTSLVAHAREQLRQELLDESRFRVLPDSLLSLFHVAHLGAAPEASVPAILVVYCRQLPSPCLRALESSNRILEPQPFARANLLLAVGGEVASPASLDSLGYTGTHDPANRLPRLLNDWTTPQFLLLDASSPNDVRYASYPDLSSALRALLLLLDPGGR